MPNSKILKSDRPSKRMLEMLTTKIKETPRNRMRTLFQVKKNDSAFFQLDINEDDNLKTMLPVLMEKSKSTNPLNHFLDRSNSDKNLLPKRAEGLS